jgi:hypothetical protein
MSCGGVRAAAVMLAVQLAAWSVMACELCAIYSADSARGQSSAGLQISVSELYVPYRTPQLDGEEIGVPDGDYVDTSITHIVPTYNFSSRVGLSLNVPLVYHSFKRSDLRYSATRPPVFETEQGSEFGIGDLALIGRVALFTKSDMNYSVGVNLLAGVKFPTGDDGRIADEVEQARLFNALLPPGTPHDPLGHSSSAIHEHNLVLGSGSYDGIFGLTVNSRWKKWFLNAQFQYYLRTEGQEDFEFGDELMISGGPGYHVVLHDAWTLNLQLNAAYETEARDRILGQKSDRTGMTAWYLGPQVGFTWGERFAGSAGGDIPLSIANNGFQNVPDYRIHASFSVRF